MSERELPANMAISDELVGSSTWAQMAASATPSCDDGAATLRQNAARAQA